MTNEEAIVLLYDIQTDAVYNVLSSEKEALDMAIKALKQQPCEDCISRQVAIDKLRDAENHAFNSYYKGLKAAHKIIADLPPVTPTRPTGQWIDIQYFEADDTYYRPKCPFCGIEPKEYSDYCPNCGAKLTELKTN